MPTGDPQVLPISWVPAASPSAPAPSTTEHSFLYAIGLRCERLLTQYVQMAVLHASYQLAPPAPTIPIICGSFAVHASLYYVRSSFTEYSWPCDLISSRSLLLGLLPSLAIFTLTLSIVVDHVMHHEVPLPLSCHLNPKVGYIY